MTLGSIFAIWENSLKIKLQCFSANDVIIKIIKRVYNGAFTLVIFAVILAAISSVILRRVNYWQSAAIPRWFESPVVYTPRIRGKNRQCKRALRYRHLFTPSVRNTLTENNNNSNNNNNNNNNNNKSSDRTCCVGHYHTIISPTKFLVKFETQVVNWKAAVVNIFINPSILLDMFMLFLLFLGNAFYTFFFSSRSSQYLF